MLYSPVYKQFTLRSLSLLFSTNIGQEMNIVIIKFQIGNCKRRVTTAKIFNRNFKCHAKTNFFLVLCIRSQNVGMQQIKMKCLCGKLSEYYCLTCYIKCHTSLQEIIYLLSKTTNTFPNKIIILESSRFYIFFLESQQ